MHIVPTHLTGFSHSILSHLSMHWYFIIGHCSFSHATTTCIFQWNHCVLQIILRTSTYKQNGTNCSWFILLYCQLYQYAGMIIICVRNGKSGFMSIMNSTNCTPPPPQKKPKNKTNPKKQKPWNSWYKISTCFAKFDQKHITRNLQKVF